MSFEIKIKGPFTDKIGKILVNENLREGDISPIETVTKTEIHEWFESNNIPFVAEFDHRSEDEAIFVFQTGMEAKLYWRP